MSKSKNEDIANLDIVEKYETYEDYLDSQLTSNDMGYLEDEEMARQLVELGYRGLGDTIRREVRCFADLTPKWLSILCSSDVMHSPFLALILSQYTYRISKYARSC